MTLRENLQKQVETRPGRPVMYFTMLQKVSETGKEYYTDATGATIEVEVPKVSLSPLSNRNIEFFDNYELVEGLPFNLVPVIRRKVL